LNTLRNELKEKYSQIPNELITDLTLSAGELRVLLYLFTKPNDWDVYNNDICKQLNISEKTLTRYWKNLLKSKWLRRERKQDEKGKLQGGYIYRIGHFTVSDKSSETDKSSDHTNNKPNNKELTNKDAYFEEFNELWSLYGKVGSKSQAFNKYKSKSFKKTKDEVLLAIRRYLKDRDILKANGEFVPPMKHFTTFLNNIEDYLEFYEPKQQKQEYNIFGV